ncbi:MAG: homoserine O-succinyltransferase [Anaerolineaceae bacterium]|nr:homoserine O-succinyltransferase [Anaerolineaceae bacterium]
MPVRIPINLPAAQTLLKENIFVMPIDRAIHQDIRPLRILFLNLMPTKIITETQFTRVLGNTPLQIELNLMSVSSHIPANTPREHMLAFYHSFAEVKHELFDGMIITGAPVEQIPFEQVDYWDELCEIMEWSKSHVYSTLHVCWGAQAALYYHYGVPKISLREKLFGVFEHKVVHKGSILFRGFDDTFVIPHSRHTTFAWDAVANIPGLKILAESEKAGIYAVSTDGGRQIFLTGHAEYDPNTLEMEYLRDKKAGLPIHVPENYYPDNDDTKSPICRWRSCGNLLYSNWLNYFVYQATPYDVMSIPPLE